MKKSTVIKHQDISTELLNNICEIKSIPWPYSIENQINWIKNNISENDLHIYLSEQDRIIAYANLIKINLRIDDDYYDGLGIGNVCSREKDKGLGKSIMLEINNYLIENKTIGLLFCKKELVGFYLRNGWKVIDKTKLNLSFDNQNVETMIFNFDKEYCGLEYLGKSF